MLSGVSGAWETVHEGDIGRVALDYLHEIGCMFANHIALLKEAFSRSCSANFFLPFVHSRPTPVPFHKRILVSPHALIG